MTSLPKTLLETSKPFLHVSTRGAVVAGIDDLRERDVFVVANGQIADRVDHNECGLHQDLEPQARLPAVGDDQKPRCVRIIWSLHVAPPDAKGFAAERDRVMIYPDTAQPQLAVMS